MYFLKISPKNDQRRTLSIEKSKIIFSISCRIYSTITFSRIRKLSTTTTATCSLLRSLRIAYQSSCESKGRLLSRRGKIVNPYIHRNRSRITLKHSINPKKQYWKICYSKILLQPYHPITSFFFPCNKQSRTFERVPTHAISLCTYIPNLSIRSKQ